MNVDDDGNGVTARSVPISPATAVPSSGLIAGDDYDRQPGDWDVRVGAVDRAFNVTVDIIILETSACVVYLDSKLDTYWKAKDHTRAQGAVLNRVAQLEAIPMTGLSGDVRKAFRCLVAEGLARMLDESDKESADKVHDQAEMFVRARLDELARSWYLTAALLGFLLCALAMPAIWLRAPLDVRDFCLGLAAGVLGASFSLISRIHAFPLDPSAGRALHTLEATARLAAGLAGALVATLAVRAKVLSFGPGPSSLEGMMLICFAAGISERFVPNLVQRIEGMDSIKAKDAADPAPAK
jgi:hypothetical protein